MRARHFALTAVVSALLVGTATGANATLLRYGVNFTGPGESPPNASPGIGVGLVEYNDSSHTLHLQVSFSGLTGTTTASHIHCCTATPFTGAAGVATTTPTFAGFPLGVSSGSFDNTLDLTLASSYNPAYITANGGTTATAELALTAGFLAGKAYWNIHSSTFPGGEIRGFLEPVPEPGTLALFASGLLGLMFARRKPKPA
jgi:hypothetical protein